MSNSTAFSLNVRLLRSFMGIRPSEKPNEADEAEAVNMLGGNTLSEEEFNALLKAKGII